MRLLKALALIAAVSSLAQAGTKYIINPQTGRPDYVVPSTNSGWPANASGCLDNDGSGNMAYVACSGAASVLQSSGIPFGSATNTVTSDTNSLTWNDIVDKTANSLVLVSSPVYGFYPDPDIIHLKNQNGNRLCMGWELNGDNSSFEPLTLCRSGTGAAASFLAGSKSVTGGLAVAWELFPNASSPYMYAPSLDLGSSTVVPAGSGTLYMTNQAIILGSATVSGAGGLGVTYGVSAGSLTLAGTGNAVLTEPNGLSGQVIIGTSTANPTAGHLMLWGSSVTAIDGGVPGTGGGTPGGPNLSVQISSAGVLGGYANFTNDGSSITITSTATIINAVSIVTETNISSVTAVGVYYDYSASTMSVGGYFKLPSRTLAQLQALTPTVIGAEYFCSTCVNMAVCYSTGTAAPYSVASSSLTRCQ